MKEREEPGGTGIELLLLEPEIVAWLDDYRPRPEPAEEECPDDDRDPLRAA